MTITLRNRWLLICSMCLVLNINAWAQDTPNRENYSLLWKIEGKGLEKPSYLFGTMHLKDRRVFGFSDSVYACFQKVDAVALELNLDTAYNEFFLGTVDKIREHIYDNILSEDEFGMVEEQSRKHGINLSRLRNRNPVTLDYLLTESVKSKDEMPMFLDAYLFYKGKELGKQMIGLESMDDQLRLIPRIGKDTLMKVILEKTDTARFRNRLEDMIRVYQTGDIQQVEDMRSEMYLGISDYVLDARNVKMVAKLDSIMPLQSLFIGVGAAHLPGEMGMITLLRDEGYSVEAVPATFTGNLDSLLNAGVDIPWHTTQDSLHGFSVETPYPSILMSDLMPGLDMSGSFDMSSQRVFMFYGVSLVTAGISDEESPTYDILLDRIRQTPGNEISKVKYLEHQGIRGVSMMLNNQRIRGTVRLFIHNKHLYLFIAASPELEQNSSDTERFFESVRFSKPVIPEYDSDRWITHEDQQGGFRVKLPAQPKPYHQRLPSEVGVVEQFGMYLTDLTRQELYLAFYQDLPASSYYDNDTLVFRELLTSMYGSEQTVDHEQGQFFEVDGVVGYEPYEPMLEGSVAGRIRTFIRGSRTYALIGQAPLDSAHSKTQDRFFDSFDLFDTPAGHWVEVDVAGIQCTLPVEPELVERESEYYLGQIDSSVIYGGTDPGTGMGFLLLKEYYSPYFRAEDYDSLLIGAAHAVVFGDYTLEDTSGGTFESGVPWFRGTIAFASSGTRIPLKVWFDNGCMHTAYAVAHVSQLDQAPLRDFIEGTYSTHIDSIPGPLTSKTNELLADLGSTDTAIAERAAGALRQYEFREEEIPRLYPLLFHDYAIKQSRVWSVHSALIYEIGEHPDDSAVAVLSRFYKQFHDSSGSAGAIRVIADLNRDDLRSVHQMLKDYPIKDSYGYNLGQIFDLMIDSSEYFKHHACELMELAEENGNTRNGLIYDLAQKPKGFIPDATQRLCVEQKIERWYSQALDSVLSAEPTYSTHQTVPRSIEFFATRPSAAYTALVKPARTLDDLDAKAALLLYDLSNGQKVKVRALNEIMKSAWQAWDFYSEVLHRGLWDRLPSKYRHDRLVAGVALKYWAEDDYYETSTPSFVEEWTDGHAIYYVFEFKLIHIDGEEETYLGMSGWEQRLTGPPSIKNNEVFIDWQGMLNAKDREAALQRLLQKRMTALEE